ncbi:MAG: beta-lactamase family protein [Chloroflexi bacterium]|nr:beta-lactamase family protein [Chloroflexota bacterium]
MKSNSKLPNHLQSLLDSFVNEQDNVHNGMLFVEGPDFKWKGASGMAFSENRVPMLPDDQWNIDSIAKTMTATIVMKLVEAKKLTVNDLISQYLADALMDGLHVYKGHSYGETITVRHLLTHTSGIADDWAHPEFLGLITADTQKHWTPEETVEFVKKNSPPCFSPGEGFQYSDPGYNLLGLIIENVTGKALYEVYRELLLDPLGMEHTYRPSREEARPSLPGRSPSHRYLDDYECTLLPAVMTADWAGGGLISTAEDLNRFLRAFVRNEIFENPTTRDEMFQWTQSAPFHNYGFGISRVLFDESDDPKYVGLGEVWGHTGSSDNFMYYWPKKDMILIGTLNQIACERKMYDNVALIMHAIQDS